jgi:hypothetical protein
LVGHPLGDGVDRIAVAAEKDLVGEEVDSPVRKELLLI